LIIYNFICFFWHVIQAPVGRVYFTGEHTSENYNGYVHGAYLAGNFEVLSWDFYYLKRSVWFNGMKSDHEVFP
jgi:hypothetical protein